MRPIELTMQSFGSYGEKVTVDFRKTSQNLFLITGNTGSGKSTIFEAIVFALYGQLSSTEDKREKPNVQSQFADTSVTPYVELTFSEIVSGKVLCYRVRRVPRHIHRREKGKGDAVKKDETVTLTLPDGSDCPLKKDEINARLEQIVGLTREQFMQVAMIAQGKFIELLRAKSDDKKAIFQKLFDTGLYASILQKLDDRQKEMDRQLGDIRAACMTLVPQVSIPDQYEAAEELREAKASVLAADRKLNTVDMDRFLNGLESLCTWQARACEEAEARTRQLEARRNDAGDAFSRGQVLDGSFRQLEAAQAALDACAAQEEAMTQAQALILQIDAAYGLKAVWDRQQDAAAQADRLEKELQAQQAQLPGRLQAASQAEAAQKAAETEYDTRSRDHAALTQRVTKALALLDGVEEKQAGLTALGQQVSREEQAAGQAEEALSQLVNQAAEKSQRLEALSNARLLLTQWEAEVREAEDVTGALTAIDSLQAEVSRLEQEKNTALSDYNRISQAHREKAREYRTLEDAFYDLQAGILAKDKLQEGQPCPVCGSYTHPNPCRLPEGNLDLTQERVSALRSEEAQLNQQRSQASVNLERARVTADERARQLADTTAGVRDRLRRNLPRLNEDCSLPDMREAAGQWKTRLAQEGRQLRAEAREAEALQTFLREAEQRKQDLGQKAQQAREAVTALRLQLAGAETELQNMEADLEFSTRQEAQAAEQAGAQREKEAKKALEQEKALAEEARTGANSCQALILRCREQIPQARSLLAQRQQDYEAALDREAMTQDQWITLTRDHRKEDIRRLQAAVSEHSRKKATASGSRDAALQAIDGREKPELQALEAEKQAADQALKATRSQQDALNATRDRNRDMLNKLQPAMADYRTRAAAAAKLLSLKNRMSGTGRGISKMDIETYVQRYYLKRVLAAANRRFSEMSAGQFVLQMTSEEQAGSGSKNRGLDLMVYSAVTGKVREVRTLSGGESFMAALSLALGMADQIQAASSAIHLDMMFIDEGFGSLDAHSRDQAVRVLQQMAGGSKLIGIISHVTELKQAIDDQLVVTKDETGSHVRWQ